MFKKSLILLFGLVISGGVYLSLLQQLEPFRILEFKGQPRIFDAAKDQWIPIYEGELVHSQERVQTKANESVLINFTDGLNLELERNSTFKGQGASFKSSFKKFEVQLLKGGVLVSTHDNFSTLGELRIETPNAILTLRSATCRIVVDVLTGADSIYVLKGRVKVERRDGKYEKPRYVRNLEKLVVRKKITSNTLSIDLHEWQLASRAYEIRPLPHRFQENQQKVATEAGSLFQLVKEHGDFFTSKHGIFHRQFYRDPDSNKIVMRAFFDVTPPMSFVGFYLMLKDSLESDEWDALEFEIKTLSQSLPNLYCDFKRNDNVVYSRPLKGVERQWKKFTIPLNNDTRRVDELAFYMTHAMAGEAKQGFLYFRNFNLVRRAKNA